LKHAGPLACGACRPYGVGVSVVSFVALFVAWFVVQRWVLPRLGVPT